MCVEDDGDDVNRLYSANLGGSPEYLLIVLDSLLADCIVHVFHPKILALIYYFLFDDLTVLMLLHKYKTILSIISECHL